ncbi:hypothetical protein G647_02087 [Cladophialophora carrionii CBS 160.54]|uniref:Amino acid permease/ SLC12A domain-containing protein n=1 Tax=Cladophialophora carrionii CBS 160.54 TaxID=1279043 RepID=V9DEN0_9EURO|nr:uncharacterized protein G647_02087 [Cladophialophora carrionii CBS 160.54]ETI25315.1 hypothetical protein G647_02087 [Cladophialophora carrionii CBS 160.54]
MTLQLRRQPAEKPSPSPGTQRFPFRRWLSKIEKKRNIPCNAVYALSFWFALLCLINIGSTTALYIIFSGTLLALTSTYMLSSGCVALHRIPDEPSPPPRWNLGRYGFVINVFALFYASCAVVLSCFPSTLPVDISMAN